VQSSPAIAQDGIIYMGSEDKSIYAIHPDGSQKWKFVTGEGVDMSPPIQGGIVYIASADGNLYALNAANGSQKWKFAGTFTSNSPAIGPDGTI